MKTFSEFMNEGKVIKKDDVIVVTLTKAQKAEIIYSMDNSEAPERLGVIKGNRLIMTPEQAINMSHRITSDYDPNYGLETLSKQLTKSLYNIGNEINKINKGS